MNKIDVKDIEKTSLGCHAQIVSGYNYLYYNSNPGNCKLCTLDYIMNWLSTDKIEYVKEVLKKSGKLAFNVSLTYETQIKFLETHFKLISVAKIPIGYSNQFQYHCCFLTENKNYSGYNRYLERINKGKSKDPIAIDSIDEIFKNLKQITEEDLVRIKSYKQPKRAKDLIAKILEKK